MTTQAHIAEAGQTHGCTPEDFLTGFENVEIETLWAALHDALEYRYARDLCRDNARPYDMHRELRRRYHPAQP